ncbi:MAG TPA: prepilin-type N-terminal cleavage/methylation domain-containing protein [Anaerohalosphaeraceae bacterium]|nr:prepilin-type N-terminal cleavage/methylation domain-containing protein [Anaerohalosphaeraceae bacterium]HPB93942.1 prepilin-type N-terminal cleavage/methylation domain-containing protein [Anaerohalosphaeraceae bacterium]HRT24527.1 prepilin-type N-terminal cleavage/methylation domain-containing protein [Anaerohalosphaeraceae bacterium]HRU16056.1 prepilin-type N-terminal cleavage/methylation domain-containing protein [Anaerohalosphaeraceae bacterium]
MKNRCQSRWGFTLAEVLISMAILAVLLTAVAAAFDASMKNYKDNEAISKTMNAARAALLRITNDIRTARGAAVNAEHTECSIDKTGDGEAEITYRYDAEEEILYLDDYSSGTEKSYVLCEHVTEMKFVGAAMPGKPNQVRNVRITMTVTDKDEGANLSRKLAAAAVVRRNL